MIAESPVDDMVNCIVKTLDETISNTFQEGNYSDGTTMMLPVNEVEYIPGQNRSNSLLSMPT